MADRILVTGDRNWGDLTTLWGVLDRYHKAHGIACIIEGEARGADRMSREWAEARGVPVDPYPADWGRYRKGAGPIRNQQMIDEGKPDKAFAFHPNLENSRGTADMVKRLENHGIPYKHYTGRE